MIDATKRRNAVPTSQLVKTKPKLRDLKIIKNANYIVTENYGPLKAGTSLNIIGSTVDSFIVSWRGKAIYLPSCVVDIEQKRTYKERKQNEFSRN